MPEYHKSCRLTLALGAQSYRAEFHGDDMFGKAVSALTEKVIAYYVRGTIEKIEAALGQFVFILGDYAAELLKAEMVPYGVPSDHIHVVTGSLLSAIENQSSGNTMRGPTGGKGHAGSVRAVIQVGMDPSAVRQEHSSLMGGSGVKLYNTGENVSNYGQLYFDRFQNESEMVSLVKDALIEIVRSRSAWEWFHASAKISYIRAQTEQLKAQNLRMIEMAAQARLAAAVR